MKLPSEARIRRWAIVSFWAADGGPPLTPPRPFFCGNCVHFIKDALASVQRRMTAVRDAESSPGGSSSNALDVTTAERARAPPQPLLMVDYYWMGRRCSSSSTAACARSCACTIGRATRWRRCCSCRPRSSPRSWELWGALAAPSGGPPAPLRAFCAPGIGGDLYYYLGSRGRQEHP